VVITGSNARLLSRELATALTGRHLQFDVFPFSFAEYLRAKGFDVGNTVPTGPADKGILFNHLSEYLKSGGYPEPAVHGIDSRSYLSTLCDAVLLKDIVRRYRLRHPDRIHTLAAWLFANFAGTFTFNSLARALGNLSVPTVETYLGHLEETYLFFMLKRFSTMLKVQLRAPRKIYVVDNGLATAKGFRASPDLGRLFENAVFLYLLRRRSVPNLDLFAYVTRNNHEVDFVVREGTKVVEAIQAAHEIGDEKTADREFRALVEASEELGAETLTLLTWDERRDERYKGKTIRIRPLAEVLLET
jgi:predicted AAA+ superfamily ATPase